MDAVDVLRFTLSFVFVLGLIGLSALALKKWGGKFGLPRAGSGNARLKIVETSYLGPRQRLVLVRRDEVEHLLVLCGDTAMVVEHGIKHEA